MLHEEKEVVYRPDEKISFSKQVSSEIEEHLHEDSGKQDVSSDADLVGISGSVLCLVHCLAPQLISLGILGAGIGTFFSGEIWAGLFWITCLWAVRKAAEEAPYPHSAVLLWFSFSTFSLGLGLETFFGADKIISYSGSILLILAHLNNYRLQRKAAALFSRLRHHGCCGS